MWGTIFYHEVKYFLGNSQRQKESFFSEKRNSRKCPGSRLLQPNEKENLLKISTVNYDTLSQFCHYFILWIWKKLLLFIEGRKYNCCVWKTEDLQELNDINSIIANLHCFSSKVLALLKYQLSFLTFQKAELKAKKSNNEKLCWKISLGKIWRQMFHIIWQMVL